MGQDGVQGQLSLHNVLFDDAFGQWWLASDDGGQRLEVLCIDQASLPADDDVHGEMERLTRVLPRLRHRHVPRVLEVTRLGTRYAIVVEHAQGRELLNFALYDAAHRTQEAIAQRLEWATQACEAVEALNAFHHPETGRGLVRDHGWVQPYHVLIDAQGELVWRDLQVPRRSGGAMVGNPIYAAFEVSWGAPDARSDVYALGLLFYELLTGQRPYDGGGATRLMQMASEDAKPLSDIAPDLPRAVQETLHKALSRDRMARFATPGEFGWALDACRRGLRAQGAAPRRLGEWMDWLRARVYEDDLSAIITLAQVKPAVIRQSVIAEYVWSHFGARLSSALKSSRPLPSAYARLIGVLPAAAPVLIEVLGEPTQPEANRVAAAQCLGALPSEAAREALCQALNAPSIRLTRSAANALARWPTTTGLWLDERGRHLRPCLQPWDSLKRLEGEDHHRVRWWPQARARVAHAGALEALRGQASPDNAYFNSARGALRPLVMHLDEGEPLRLSVGLAQAVGVSHALSGSRLAPHHLDMIAMPGEKLLLRARQGDLRVDEVSVSEWLMALKDGDGLSARFGAVKVWVDKSGELRSRGLRRARRAGLGSGR